MSFARAAAELNVTPAALSFQIKSLEEHLGAPVFRRLNRAVELTEAGRALSPGATEGFTQLSAAWRAARRVTDTQTITVTAGPAFTAKWLAPRMFDFAVAHPEIEMRFSASLRIMDFDRDDIDVAIRFGMGDDAGLFSIPLIREWVTPMVAPALASKLKSPEDLLGMTLLGQDDTVFLDPPIDWSAWLRAAGVTQTHVPGPWFSQADHAIDAALAGGGAVLGRASLVSDHLRDGQLVAPFDLALTTEAHYRFVCLSGMEDRPHIAAFLDWIVSKTKTLTQVPEGLRMIAASDVPR
jgi:LysR family glycine cleavage system transcriptional activator